MLLLEQTLGTRLLDEGMHIGGGLVGRDFVLVEQGGNELVLGGSLFKELPEHGAGLGQGDAPGAFGGALAPGTTM